MIFTAGGWRSGRWNRGGGVVSERSDKWNCSYRRIEVSLSRDNFSSARFSSECYHEPEGPSSWNSLATKGFDVSALLELMSSTQFNAVKICTAGSRAIKGFWMVLCLATLTTPAMGDNRSWHSGELHQTSYANWMRWVPDHVPLSQLSLPASHDTMSHYGGASVKTQSLPIGEQLKAGIRALDIRGRHIDDRFAIHHGAYYQNAMFGDVLIACNAFLDQNPSETIVLWLSAAGVPEEQNVTRLYYETFLWYRDVSGLGSKISKTINRRGYNAPLGDARGKIVIIEDFSCGSCGLGGHEDEMPGNGISTVLGTSASMQGKWNAFQSHADVIDSGTDVWMYQNSLAGSGGVFPIDAANGFLGIEGQNSRAVNYLFGRNVNRTTGLLYFDFPGAGLISSIIAHNMKFATNLALMAGDFEKVFEEVSYAATHDGNNQSADHATQLKAYLDHILPNQHWSVLVSATPGGDNWGFSVEPEGLYHKTDFIDGYSHVAVNARRLNADVTKSDILAYLTLDRLGTLSGDAVARASGTRALLRSRFPWVHWNAAVKRLPFDAGKWATVLETTATVEIPLADEGELYLHTVWASSGINRPPVANPGPDYTVIEGAKATFNAERSSDPDGDRLQFRWDFDGDNNWDTARIANPIASWIYADNLDRPAWLEVFDGELATIEKVPLTIVNVAPTIDAGQTATLNGLTLNRECQIIDPGADIWTVEIVYGDGSPRVTMSGAPKTFLLNHTFPAPGTYTVQIQVRDDDGGSSSTNLQVVLTGNPDPAPQAVQVEKLSNGNVRLGFSGTPGRSYHVIASDKLGVGVWAVLGTLAAGPDGRFTFEDTNSQSSRFYRAVSTQ